jgi:ribonucleoside-triphosphate reductase
MKNTTLGLYESYIHKSRYARYLPDENRREHWEETVARYVNFMKEHLASNYNYKNDEVFQEVYDYIVDMRVMPSMRAMMTAGKALARDNTAGYNCSYMPVDDPKAFDECMHILMNGTGVGFSVERQYINKLPEIPEQMFDSDTTIVVKDSKEGWSKALRMLIALLYTGEIPKWDTTKVRLAGSPLKTFGGRSSGPGPLNELFKFVVRIFTNAKGRKLTSLECHDIMCKIAEVVVVGGVRRSAMISLSNLSDDRMRNAKSGAWWEANVQRALSNNSAVYTEKPEVGMFLEEWLSLYQSKSGERGIFSREASQKVAKKSGRRDFNQDFGTNPCSEIILRPYQFCNLTEVVVRENDTEETLAKKVRIATILGTFQSTLTNFPYLRKIWQKNTEEERLLGVSLTGIYDSKLLNDYKDAKLPGRLEKLRQVAIDVNKELAEELGIPVSAAITAVKPSGTVSQLTDSASGIHPRHDPYYFRRVRSDIKDPLTKHLITAGIPNEPDVTKPDSTVVFTFPKKAPEDATMRGNVSAIDHLELWLKYQRHWCEHKPSVTISVKEEEWPTVGAWVWEHFDEMSGVSFLPYDGGTYRQAPYETVTKEQYEELLSKMPTNIDWSQLVEREDNVEGVQTLACTAGNCEI